MTETSPTRKQNLRKNSLERRERGKLELRQTILEAAVGLFERQGGFENFSLRQVAEEIGYSATTIYLHFADKEELIFHVALEGFAAFGQQLEAAYAHSDDVLLRIRLVGRAYLNFALENPIHYRLMFMQRGDFLERKPPGGQVSVIDSFGILRRAVEAAMKAGALDPGDPQAVAGLLWTHVHGVAALHIATPYFPKEQAEGLFEWSMTIAARGLGARAL